MDWMFQKYSEKKVLFIVTIIRLIQIRHKCRQIACQSLVNVITKRAFVRHLHSFIDTDPLSYKITNGYPSKSKYFFFNICNIPAFEANTLHISPRKRIVHKHMPAQLSSNTISSSSSSVNYVTPSSMPSSEPSTSPSQISNDTSSPSNLHVVHLSSKRTVSTPTQSPSNIPCTPAPNIPCTPTPDTSNVPCIETSLHQHLLQL